MSNRVIEILNRIIINFDCSSGCVRYKDNKERATIFKICKLIGICSNTYNEIKEVLEQLGIVAEVRFDKKRYLDLNDNFINILNVPEIDKFIIND